MKDKLMIAAILREEQTKAETVKAVLLGVTAAAKSTDPDKLVDTLDRLMEGLDAMYVPLSADERARKTAARKQQEVNDLELLEKVGGF